MTSRHWQLLIIYAGALLVATLLAVARRVLKRGSVRGSLERKYPSYILMNLVFLAASWTPPAFHLLSALLACLGGLAAWEIVRALLQRPSERLARPGESAHADQTAARRGWAFLFAGASAVLILGADWLNPDRWMTAWLAAFLLLTILSAIIGAPPDYGRRALALLGCIVYVTLCLTAYVRVWQADPSGFRVVFLYLVIATNDAMAQITGELFGSRPLAPRISPAKTVEGALGGILFAGLLGAAASGVLGWSGWTGAALGVALGCAGLAGDLAASVWKRALGLRDFGTVLGAHGGVLDRFDGLIFAAPVFLLLTMHL